MRHNVKITKREIKEDKFTTFVFQAKDYVTERWAYFVGAAAVIVIIIVGISFIRSQNASRTSEAADIYNRALGEYRAANYQLAVVDFKTIMDDYGSTSFGPQATFNLGNAYFAAKNYTEAQSAFENYLEKYKDDKYFVTSAMAGIAASLAGAGDFKQAADKYREAAEKYPDFKLAGEYYLHALENYVKADEMESAKVILAKLTNDYRDTQYFMMGARLAAEHGLRL
jgi:outer membrane protein assembly factor BamD (BamD/ComL family)